MQPLYYGAQPLVFNFTIANGMGNTGYIRSVTWTEASEQQAVKPPRAVESKVLDVKTEYPAVLWPWSG